MIPSSSHTSIGFETTETCFAWRDCIKDQFDELRFQSCCLKHCSDGPVGVTLLDMRARNSKNPHHNPHATPSFENETPGSFRLTNSLVAGFHTDAAGQPSLPIGSASEFVYRICLPLLRNLKSLNRALLDASITIGAILPMG